MQAEPKRSEQSSVNSNQTLVAGLFYTFLLLTVLAFLLRLFGLTWFDSHVDMEEPSLAIQKGIKFVLKAFELTFVYKILTKKGFIVCAVTSVVQTALTPFLGAGMYQSLADTLIMFALPLVFRKDKGWAILDTLFLYALMCLYGALSLVGKFGEVDGSHVYSFYAAILNIVDYKLFIVTLYLFIKYKGGIRLWKSMKRPLLER